MVQVFTILFPPVCICAASVKSNFRHTWLELSSHWFDYLEELPGISFWVCSFQFHAHSFKLLLFIHFELSLYLRVLDNGSYLCPLLALCPDYRVAIWETGEWLEKWTFFMFIPLPQKSDLKQCANYRTITFVSHASNILLWIILERIRVKSETEIADKQAGFRKGRISEYWNTRHASTSNHSICALGTSRRHSTQFPMMSSGWLWWTWDLLCTWLTCWPANVKVTGTLLE